MMLALILLVLPVQPAHAAVNEAQNPITVGAARAGWVSDGGTWYYYVSGKAVTGWREIAGVWYYFASSGAMQTGWQQIGGKWYYFRGSGRMVTGWQEIGGAWYYFAASGRMLTGWQEISGKWYYLASSGKMVTGWQKISGKWYYFASSGKMATGWQKVSGKWYYFASSGKMVTGWKEISEKWYYFESSGAMKTGWLQEKGHWYMLKSDGSMAVAEMVGAHYFDTRGYWVNGLSPESELTLEHVLALLDFYDPDGAFLYRNTLNTVSDLAFLHGDAIIDSVRSTRMDTAVHERCHIYTFVSTPGFDNPYTGKNLDSAKRYYMGGGESIEVPLTPLFDSREMADEIPETLRTERFPVYIDTDVDSKASRQEGVYGLLDEFTAYYWGFHDTVMLEPFVDQDGEYRFNFASTYYSWAEFRYYILKYILYAKDHYPDVYQGIVDNEDFGAAFTAIDSKFRKTLQVYFDRHDMDWDVFDAFTEEMNKKEYLEMIEILKP